MKLTRELRTFLFIPLFALIGIVLSAILEIMNTRGYIVDEYFSGTLTLAELQLILILICLFFGIILGVTSPRRGGKG